MNYRSYSDLDRCILTNLWRIPREVDLIVGIPRSGLMVGSILALYLNLPLTDIDTFLDGRNMYSGRRFNSIDRNKTISEARKILIVDDSCSSGYEINRVKSMLMAASYDLKQKFIFSVIYVAPHSTKHVDIYFEICPIPRVFSWNINNHVCLENACVDIDGVLCFDPLEEENDDGEQYIKFLKETKPLSLPYNKVGALVTCRLEKYRKLTEEWLNKHGVNYGELVMWDLPNKEARLKSDGHGNFKGRVFKEREWADVFIESSWSQALDITNVALKPVICIETQSVCTPEISALGRGYFKKIPKVANKRFQAFRGGIKSYLLKKVRY